MTSNFHSATAPTWYGTLPASKAAQAVSVAQEVASRVGDPDRLLDAINCSTAQAVHPMGWYVPGLGHGHAGVALLPLHAASVTSDENSRKALFDTARGLIREAFAGSRIQPLDSPALFSGISGLALVLSEFVEHEPRFRPSLERLHAQLAEQVLAWEIPRNGLEVLDSHYDLISGASGVLTYLSCVPEPSADLRRAADRLVDYLVWLGAPADDPACSHRWFTAPEQLPSEMAQQPGYEKGSLNLGLAHGMPGILLALASAWQAGLWRPGHRETIRRLAEWLVDVQSPDDLGPMWHTDIGAGTAAPPQDSDDRLAWCYGTAGVATALLAAGDALDEAPLRRTAVRAFEAALLRARRRPPISPTFCHGVAGLLAMSLEFSSRSLSPSVRAFVPVLLDDLLAAVDHNRLLVFADEEQVGNMVDSPSLLSGATGVALTLLAAVEAQRPTWLRAFLGR